MDLLNDLQVTRVRRLRVGGEGWDGEGKKEEEEKWERKGKNITVARGCGSIKLGL
jgi:hypothetical protein